MLGHRKVEKQIGRDTEREERGRERVRGERKKDKKQGWNYASDEK